MPSWSQVPHPFVTQLIGIGTRRRATTAVRDSRAHVQVGDLLDGPALAHLEDQTFATFLRRRLRGDNSLFWWKGARGVGGFR
ncbi:predicted protein [Streptomyces viridosporus ATCC 14672]|uniref:Predicted protein n=1 Tax=Streptomyces viridosporus (strain ATCC 14672 / DSM 40746 / JCM 4963 / KCTC 9882 / NRRL B-12104 / FH 1290) TaxID=566461 RepID=D5ZVI0_STRV1|nr:predicted protein [Streptomyces viridosporus ATCC 14672]